MNNTIEKINKKLKSKGGFTLIELIVVIVIIGILAAIIIPRLSGFSKSAQERADLATARTIFSAVSVAIAEDPAFSGTGLGDLPDGLLETLPAGTWSYTIDPIVVKGHSPDSAEVTYPAPSS